MYYYTDAEELDALRVENARLKQEVENLKKQVTVSAIILPRGAGRNQKDELDALRKENQELKAKIKKEAKGNGKAK